MKIYYNPHCSKCRIAFDVLKEQKPEIVEYLKTPPTKEELRQLLQKLGMRAEDIVRKNEELYKQKFADQKYSEEEWLNILVTNPTLIQRPIIVKGNKAVIGRTEEALREIAS